MTPELIETCRKLFVSIAEAAAQGVHPGGDHDHRGVLLARAERCQNLAARVVALLDNRTKAASVPAGGGK
jgi:hypothetical protein